MSNSSSTTLPEPFANAIGRALDNTTTPTAPQAPPPQPPQQQQSESSAKPTPGGLVTLLAKSLRASRPDWRVNRHSHTAYASSRVSYVETEMTEAQAREFE